MPIIQGGRVSRGVRKNLMSRSLGSPALGAVNAVHAAAAVLAAGGPQVISTGITQPDVPRNITATAGGTAGDIKAVAVTITGTDENGVAITEVLPAFTVDTAGTVTGSRIFKTVTSYSVPAMDGTGATVAIGTGDKLGIGGGRYSKNQVNAAYLNGVREATAPTVAFDATNQYGNSVQLNSALDGSPVIVEVWE